LRTIRTIEHDPLMAGARDVFLASGSPRRGQLLRQIGVAFRLVHAPVDETHDGSESPEQYVLRLSRTKAEAGWQALPPRAEPPQPTTGLAVVLGADTAVVLDGRILGKPNGREHGLDMLSQLSGRNHRVLTAVALSDGTGVRSRLSRSEVTFRSISETERVEYWLSGEPADKAGGYAIQGFGACFVQNLHGSYSGVMGLPIFETACLLDAAGVARWQPAEHP
jgi:septum formation protein